MLLPYRIATLLYVFDPQDRVLLLERAQEPNLGLWSPPGGKLHTDHGESPHACACREAAEELGWDLQPSDLHLTGLISERGFANTAHWLMFLFEVLPKRTTLPPPMREGRFAFFHHEELSQLPLPPTDREALWPWFFAHRNGFFAARAACQPHGPTLWTLEESRPTHPSVAPRHGCIPHH